MTIDPLTCAMPPWVAQSIATQIGGCPCNGSCAICRPPVDLRGACWVEHPPLFGPFFDPVLWPGNDVIAHALLAEALFGWLR
jgi:hypothetical protein